jgi:hypothetical protein
MGDRFHLLHAFAAKHINGKARINLSLPSLQARGYDTEELEDLVRSYEQLQNDHRRFAFSLNESTLSIARLSAS